MAFLKRSWSRLSSSQRGENFNPLSWPFLLTTLAYGVGFAFFFPFTDALGTSSVYNAMASVGEVWPFLWGVVAVLNIILGASFLVFNIPPFGKISGLIGFALWLFVAICYAFNHDWMVLVGIAGANMWFWIWQYMSLTAFRKQDSDDLQTMRDYAAGRYDDENGGRELRLNNRGADEQKDGRYVHPDDGTDASRKL